MNRRLFSACLLSFIGTKTLKSEPQNTRGLPKITFKDDQIVSIEGISFNEPTEEFFAWVNKEDGFLQGRYLIYGKVKVNIHLSESGVTTLANIELLSTEDSFKIKANPANFVKKIRFFA